MHRDRVMQILVYASGFLCALIFIGSKSRLVMEEWFPPNPRNGDLYEMARVSAFYEPRPPIDTTRSPLRVENANDADLIVFGDSFTRAASGHATFVDQLADSTGKTVWIGGRYSRSALVDLDASRPRTVIIESIDRFIDLDFAGDLTPAPAPPGRPEWFTTALDWRLRIFRNTELNSRLLIGNLPGGRTLVNALADARYEWLGEISEKTPIQTFDPPTLFYYQNIESGAETFFKGAGYTHTDLEIENLADQLARLDRALHAKNARLLFLPIPNKYLLYGGATESDDQFLPRLHRALETRGVASIDLYTTYRRSPERVFWASDTHWNARGVELALGEIVAALEGGAISPALAPRPHRDQNRDAGGRTGAIVPAHAPEEEARDR